ncbi:Peptidoglycan/LPS O-acetylase OafA/YrhL, contains acyltransferase and SGNH-hydrolase domains [Flaviramulus basaltis]|uniref:Peptidoglycan/LPS O-acetylase OafA/YrhL, contains acyltransferase and SGNH-hydrolase domains n=1 Tax=Flaviramulus basaltis TaxID=369401 RepID=A0A1K2IKI8_9FLAO|nr:acyltransferase [Flaviramulus basaltis]SFZ92953.1 Peptidoglycan/LPS O-acetylase OafA/YrhL, contains acyltransferase and SGNH-hydrolase domains [Flaviramulus basaltis]
MHKDNNFDFLRFLFAVFVVISHAYALSGVNESSEWFHQISNGQIVLSQLGLSGFFIISGYFIFQSLQRSKSFFSYYKKRFLRLFPALFFVLLLTLILAPFVYKSEISFFQNKEVYSYLPYNLLLYFFQSGIKGIFDTNAYHAINGSLWTIRYEFSLYVAIGLLYFFRNDFKGVRILIAAVFAILIITYNFFIERFAGSSILGMQGYHILNLGTFFVCGSLLASFNFEEIKSSILLIITIIVFALAIYFNFYNYIKHIVFPIMVLLIGFAPLPFFSTFGKIGDLSYGIYIYSFPVQQTMIYFFDLNVYQLIIYSLMVSIMFGYLSWHFVEKKALAYKKNFLKFN